MAIFLIFLSIKSVAMYTNTNYVHQLYTETINNELLMATTGGLVIYNIDNNTFSVWNNASGLPTNICYSVTYDSTDGTIWVGSKRGLSMISQADIIEYPLPIIASSDIRVVEGFGDTIFAGSSNGLVVIDTKGTLDFTDDDVILITKINNLISDTVLSVNIEDKIWVGTDNGLSRFHHDLSYDTSFTTNNGLPGPKVLALFGIDSIFIGTDSGLAIIKNDIIDTLKMGEEIRDLIQIGDTIFFASDSGFGIYHQGSVSHQNDSLPTKDVRCLEYAIHKRWLGFGSGRDHQYHGKGIAYFEGFWQNIVNPGPNSNWIADIEIDRYGTLYLAHGERSGAFSAGASSFADETIWTDMNDLLPDTCEPFDLVHRVRRDRLGRIWFAGNWKGGLFYFDPQDSSWGHYDSLVTNIPIIGVWDIDFDQWNNMLIGIAWPPDLGPALIDSALEKIAFLPGEDNAFVAEVEADDSGRYWIGYDKEGLQIIEHNNTPFNLEDDIFKYFTITEGLLSVNGRAITADGKGGLYYLSEKGLSYYFDDQFENFDNTNSPMSGRLYTIAIDSQDRIWILGSTGLFSFDPMLQRWNAYYFVDLGLDLGFREVEEFQNHALLFDSDRGALWFGSKNGLTKVVLQETEQTTLDSILIYPNPSTSGITIFGNLPDDAEITIFSITGRKIATLENPDPTYKSIRWNWNAEAEKSGIYLALIKSDLGKMVVKFAIIR